MKKSPPASAFAYTWHSLVLASRLEHLIWVAEQISNRLDSEFRHFNGRMLRDFLDKHPPKRVQFRPGSDTCGADHDVTSFAGPVPLRAGG